MDTAKDNLIRIVIIDSHTLIRAGLYAIIQNQPGLCVVGSAGHLDEAVSVVEQEKPDIVLLKLNSYCEIGPEIIPELMKVSINSRIILLALRKNEEHNLEALKQGALGIVFTTQKPEILMKAIEKVNIGEVWIERSLIANMLNDLSHTNNHLPEDPRVEHISEITPREYDVIALIGKGLKNQDIAERLHLSETTVRHHLTSIYTKLDVSSRLELLVFANDHGII